MGRRGENKRVYAVFQNFYMYLIFKFEDFMVICIVTNTILKSQMLNKFVMFKTALTKVI